MNSRRKKRTGFSKWFFIFLEDSLASHQGRRGFPRWMRTLWGNWIGWKCEDCSRRWSDGWILEFHHIRPRSVGGRNNFLNIRCLCLECHRSAHYWLAEKHGWARGSLPLLKRRWEKTRGRWKRDKTLATYY